MEDPELENFSLLQGGGGEDDGGGDWENHHDSSNRGRGGRHRRNPRKIRKWGPRGIARRIRGQGVPDANAAEVQESLLDNNRGGFHDAEEDPSSLLERRPINAMSSDEEDDDDDDDDDDYYEKQYYGDGYRDAAEDYRYNRQQSQRNNSSSGSGQRRGPGLLRGLSKIRPRLGSRSFSDREGPQDRNRHSQFDPYWSSNSSVAGRIEGFGSSKATADYTNPRTLRELLKDFRERRISARQHAEEGMQKMQVGTSSSSKRKNWMERLDSVMDAMIDAAASTPELDGYMTSTTRTVTSSATAAGAVKPAAEENKKSYLRREFGDDNAYIIYLEGEMVASELEIASYKARIKALEAQVRELKGEEDNGDEGDDDSDSSADSSDDGSAKKDAQESEIEWETKAPEEGILIDMEGASSEGKASNAEAQSSTPQPNLDKNMVETEKNASTPTRADSADGSQEQANDNEGSLIDLEPAAESSREGTLIDLTAQEEAKDKVDAELIEFNAQERQEHSLVAGTEEKQHGGIETKVENTIGDNATVESDPTSGETQEKAPPPSKEASDPDANVDSSANIPGLEGSTINLNTNDAGTDTEYVGSDKVMDAEAELQNDEDSGEKKLGSLDSTAILENNPKDVAENEEVPVTETAHSKTTFEEETDSLEKRETDCDFSESVQVPKDGSKDMIGNEEDSGAERPGSDDGEGAEAENFGT
eukprot:scaffold22733_cov214-Cylindrotheca_fusiformis.AAC.4